MNQTLHFLNQVQSKGKKASIGAIAPTSGFAARAMAEECARHVAPKKVLELGAGTGAITTHILPCIGPHDQLVLCEIHPAFVEYLQQRIETEPAFLAHQGRVTLQAASAAELEGEGEYDYIICSIPFTILPPDLVRAIFERCRVLLKPGGIMSYIEYAWLRGLRRHLMGPLYPERFRSVDRVVNEYISQFQIARRTVMRNLPPAWIRYLRFSPGPASRALALEPLEDRFTMKLPFGWGLSREAVKGATLMTALSALMRALKIPYASAPLAAAAGYSAFLRDPERKVRLDTQLAYSAADGTVLAIETRNDPRLGEGEWVRISTFLGVNDVHINRSPIAGKIVDGFSRSGGNQPAFRPGAEHNHSRFTVIEGLYGRCAVAQRVGVLARRIVNWFGVGDLLAQGERYGLIRFGSRTDVYLPSGMVEVLVKPGDRVVGGITPLARYTCERARESAR